MYEHFRNELSAKLMAIEDELTIDKVLCIVDQMSTMYTITQTRDEQNSQETELPEVVQVYLMARRTEGLASGTIKGYKNILGLFFSHIGKPVEEITTNDIRMWLGSYQFKHKITNETLETYRVSINSFFNWAVQEQYLTKSPCKRIKPIKFERRPRKALGQLQLEYIRHACKTSKERALVQFLYSTGCRISEVVGAKLSDINWATNEVTVLGKGSKIRTCYLNAKAIVALKAYLADRKGSDDHLFLTERYPYDPIGKPGLERIIRIVCNRCGELGMHVTPHVFRHTTATVALQNGMPVQDVQRMLGHSSISTTMIYAETNQNEVKILHERCVI